MKSEGFTNPPIDVRRQFLVWRIVAGSMMIAVGLFAGGGIVLTRLGSFTPLTGAAAQATRWGAVVIVFLGMAVASALGRRLRQVTDGTGGLAVLKAYGISVVVPEALRENLGLMGVVAGVLIGSESWILLFAAASVTSQFLSRPKMSDLEAMLQTASVSQG
jgi:hypothetical protein